MADNNIVITFLCWLFFVKFLGWIVGKLFCSSSVCQEEQDLKRCKLGFRSAKINVKGGRSSQKVR